MKCICKRITALLLVLLMTASFLASCSGKTEDDETSNGEENGIPVYDGYTSKKVDLGLSENETIFDIIEMDGMLRATIGVADSPGFLESGIPYQTEHRWYSMDFVEDTTKREKTKSHHEITFVPDPAVDFVLGGDSYKGKVRYFFYRDGEAQGDALNPMGIGEDPNQHPVPYNARAHIILQDDVAYTAIDYGALVYGVSYGLEWKLYVNGNFLDTSAWRPGMPKYTFCGLIGIKGDPYALLEIEDKGRLVPLTPETTELPVEGIDIDGCPTGGAFSDGRFGYFMSGTQLWRTDGEASSCIADLVPYGVTLSSMVRSVRALSDGRLLVVVDGKLVELTGSDGPVERITACTIGVIDYEGILDFLNLSVAKYNDLAENVYFQIKEYEDIVKLNLDILSGEVSMVITPDRFALNNYVKQGLLAPLEEVAPKLFEKDVLIENVVEAARIDGTCYYLPREFTVRGECVTKPDLLKDGNLFETRQAYCDFISEHDPDYFAARTPGDIFENFAHDLDEWIDWEANTAHFDDGSFAALLEFCSQGSTREEVTEYWSEKSATESQWGRNWKAASFTLTDTVESYRFTQVKEAQDYQKDLPKEDGEGGPETWVQVDFPMPSVEHEGYEIFAENFFAVVNEEESKEAAGEFLTWFILENVEEEYPEKNYAYEASGFPISQKETERYLGRLLNGHVDPEAEVAALDEESAKYPNVVMSIRNAAQIHNMQCGQEQYDITWSYIEKADHFGYAENEIYKVMLAEAGSYFAGSITAEKAAEYVQNRISLYLAEQG